MNKIDVCLVTKNPHATIRGLDQIPIGKLIVETSKPLGQARQKAIAQVSTEWFAFVDDDVQILSQQWFETLSKYAKGNVGAVEGIMSDYGRGKLDPYFNAQKRRENAQIQSLKMGDRGYTHNTLIRTDLVKDWVPSRDDLSAYEDYEITQYILRKDYAWLRVPAFDFARHRKGWTKECHNAVWGMQGLKRVKKSHEYQLLPLKYAIEAVRILLFSQNPLSMRLYVASLRLPLIYGVIFA